MQTEAVYKGFLQQAGCYCSTETHVLKVVFFFKHHDVIVSHKPPLWWRAPADLLIPVIYWVTDMSHQSKIQRAFKHGSSDIRNQNMFVWISYVYRSYLEGTMFVDPWCAEGWCQAVTCCSEGSLWAEDDGTVGLLLENKSSCRALFSVCLMVIVEGKHCLKAQRCSESPIKKLKHLK